MSTQQYSQFPNSYYGSEHYPYHQYMNGSQPQSGQSQPQSQAAGQQPLSQQQLQGQSAQYAQQPYGQYYMVNNQQAVQPGQQPIQSQQSPQQAQYSQYHQQSQQPQTHQSSQQSQHQGDYGVHYPGYGSSATSGPYAQYAMYQQVPQASGGAGSAGTSVPSSSLYAAPGQQGGQTPAPTSSSGTAPSQTGAPGSSAASTAQSSSISNPKGSGSVDGLGLATNSTVGQYQPPGIRPRVTTTMWEDEKTLCYQVDANNVSVVRRADNNMINGTKLLNVAQMTRGRRDGILKSEKIRHVVKIGSMHLKGVWIPFERALAMAQREGIVDLLYPLFVRDIKRVIQTGVTPNSQTSSSVTAPAAVKTPIAASSSYPSGSGSGMTNTSAGYYQQYPAQYLQNASGTNSGLSDGSGSASAPHQQQIAAQQQLYGYSQPSYYNQYYSQNQGASTASGNGATSSNYSSYGQAPMYSSYGGYSQAPQGQNQAQKGYDQSQQPQTGMTHPQVGSPGLKDKKDSDNK